MIRCSQFAQFFTVVAVLAVFITETVHGQIVPNPAHNWDANLDSNGNTIWEDIGTLANRPWTLAGSQSPNTSGPTRTAVASSTSITHAYAFDGVDDSGSATNENRSGNHDTSFEVWFKPSTFPASVAGSASVLFEHGNGPRGITLGLSGTMLVFAYRANPDAGILSFNLDLGGDGIDNTDFIQAVGVMDDTNNQIRLYVDGGNQQTFAIGASSDFTSNDDLGLGLNSGLGGGGQDSTGLTWNVPYSGQIAIVREYRSAFTTSQVLQNFNAISVPEPATAGMGLVALLLLARKRRS